MATLHQRLCNLGYILSVEQKQELGKIVKEQFFNTPMKEKFYRKVDQKEHGQVLKVLFYDKRFTPRIDQLITFFAELHGLKSEPNVSRGTSVVEHKHIEKPHPQPSVPIRKRERKRITPPSAKQPAYSAKPKNNQ
jgi:hypothetical protein